MGEVYRAHDTDLKRQKLGTAQRLLGSLQFRRWCRRKLVRLAGSTWMPFIGARSIIRPPSIVPRPPTLWPPPRVHAPCFVVAGIGRLEELAGKGRRELVEGHGW